MISVTGALQAKIDLHSEDGVPEIVACYEDTADAQAEADERNAEEEQ